MPREELQAFMEQSDADLGEVIQAVGLGAQ
jgi:hypothetical protein